ncbi:MAG: glutathione S-transferase C-terminal domain-containing protein [Burkholderiaceae bacterium]
MRALKGLEQVISVDVVHPHLTDQGWSFDTGFHGATGDTVAARQLLREAYPAADPLFKGVVTVPVLWDKRLGTIVNNESAEIIRMLNSGFQAWARHPELDLYPLRLRTAIDETNAWVYADINNGVYRSGFARSQQAHEAAVERLFAALDRAEAILMRQDFLCGDVLTEADIRLFVTLIRFGFGVPHAFQVQPQDGAPVPGADALHGRHPSPAWRGRHAGSGPCAAPLLRFAQAHQSFRADPQAGPGCAGRTGRERDGQPSHRERDGESSRSIRLD